MYHNPIALWRLYLLRAACLLIAAGMGLQIVPVFSGGRTMGVQREHRKRHASRSGLSLVCRFAIPAENVAPAILGDDMESYLAAVGRTSAISGTRRDGCCNRGDGIRLRLGDRDCGSDAMGFCLASVFQGCG